MAKADEIERRYMTFTETDVKGEYRIDSPEHLRKKWKAWDKTYFNFAEIIQVIQESITANIEVKIVPHDRTSNL